MPFAGWEMPVQYGDGIRAEHLAVRGSAGIFDVSHMGEVACSGPGAEAFLQHVCSNDVTKMAIGRAQYSLLCNEDGGVLDDLFTYRLAPDRYLTVTNAANHDADVAWLRAHAGDFDVDVHDAGDEYAMLAVQGPVAREIVQAIADGPLPARMTAAPQIVFGREVLVCGTGYTGEDGVELLLDPEDAPAIWDEVVRRGATPAGWPPATRCASRPAFTSTATTCRPSAGRSRPASAGPARRTRASSVPTPCARRAPPARARSSSRSS